MGSAYRANIWVVPVVVRVVVRGREGVVLGRFHTIRISGLYISAMYIVSTG